MTRRDFIAAVTAAGLFRSKAATPFPVRYAKPNPYELVLRYIDPGADEFQTEKAAAELEARLARPNTRVYALPEGRVRYEIKTATEYRTAIWQLPDRKAVTGAVITSPKPY